MKKNFIVTKILKANNDFSLNQQTEHQNRKVKEKDILLLNIPLKSHTIDHQSKSNSRQKKNLNHTRNQNPKNLI